MKKQKYCACSSILVMQGLAVYQRTFTNDTLCIRIHCISKAIDSHSGLTIKNTVHYACYEQLSIDSSTCTRVPTCCQHCGIIKALLYCYIIITISDRKKDTQYTEYMYLHIFLLLTYGQKCLISQKNFDIFLIAYFYVSR